MATAEATESTREFSTDTKELGDRIVGLTLKAAKELSDYLDEVHGIEPATGGAVMVAAGAGAGGDGGGEPAAEKTEFDVVLESFGVNSHLFKSHRDWCRPSSSAASMSRLAQ